jgi:hypothetical protein
MKMKIRNLPRTCLRVFTQRAVEVVALRGFLGALNAPEIERRV